jgi:hypothetical protein
MVGFFTARLSVPSLGLAEASGSLEIEDPVSLLNNIE